jgi:hypothetical protein
VVCNTGKRTIFESEKILQALWKKFHRKAQQPQMQLLHQRLNAASSMSMSGAAKV